MSYIIIQELLFDQCFLGAPSPQPWFANQRCFKYHYEDQKTPWDHTDQFQNNKLNRPFGGYDNSTPDDFSHAWKHQTWEPATT